MCLVEGDGERVKAKASWGSNWDHPSKKSWWLRVKIVTGDGEEWTFGGIFQRLTEYFGGLDMIEEIKKGIKDDS